ncbi:MAG: Na/Pi cotransporter family protein [Clostridia bacterium]|nr:Na/Pi cotransporter family protein [Clostridia bacterium]
MNWMDLFTLLGGLGLFLFGMKLMGDGLEKAAGARMKKLLSLLTGNRLLAVVSGLLITAIIQSSSATTVMVVGFVNGGLLTLTQAVGVIMGANIGTTVTSLLLSVKVDFSVLLAFAGLALSLPKRESIRQAGTICMGLAILFTGMNWMSNAMAPLREWDGFRRLMSQVSHPIAGVALGAVMTAVLQSSSASVGILQALTAQGLLPLNSAMFVLFGQNIGTCITAMIASAGANRTARQAAMVHLLFNVLGSCLFTLIAIVLPFADWIAFLSPDNLRLQIALTHLIFNLVTTVLLFPFANHLEQAARALVPPRKGDNSLPRLVHFDPRMLSTPSIAVEQLRKEVMHLCDLAQHNLQQALQIFFQWRPEIFNELITSEDTLDQQSHLITEALVDASSAGLTDHNRHFIGSLFHLVNDLERIGDHAMNVAECAQERARHGLAFSDESIREIADLAQMAEQMMHTARSGKPVAASEDTMDHLTQELRSLNIARLQSRLCSAQSSAVYMDMLINLERVADHCNNIAELLTDEGTSLTNELI